MSSDGINYFTCNQTGEKVDSEGRGYFTITGMQESTTSQSVKITTSEGSYTTATVMVSWNNSIVLDNYSLSGTPDETYKINYKVCPPDSTLSWTGHSGYMTITECVTKTDENYREGYLKIVPSKETPETGLDITLTHTNSSTGKVFQKLTVPMVFTYSKYDFKVSNLFIDGYFSKYDETSNIFTLSDGDTIAFDLETEQKFVTIETLRADTAACSDKVTVTVGNNNKTITIKNKDNTDYTSDVYKITKIRYPSGDSWKSSKWRWTSNNNSNPIQPAAWWVLYCGSTYYGRTDTNETIDSSVTSYSEYSDKLNQAFSNVTMYIPESEFKNYPYLYQKTAQHFDWYGSANINIPVGPLAINSNASLTNSEGKKYKAPASSGVLSEPKPIGSAQVGLTITTSSGKTIIRTIYISVERRYCSRNDNDLVE